MTQNEVQDMAAWMDAAMESGAENVHAIKALADGVSLEQVAGRVVDTVIMASVTAGVFVHPLVVARLSFEVGVALGRAYERYLRDRSQLEAMVAAGGIGNGG
jgi:uncharacterized protein (UPF0261 family)